MARIKKLYQNDKSFALVTAMIVVLFTFLVFWGQKVYSDVVTFAKYGDQMQLCYSSFIKLGRNLHDGIFLGVDYGSSNGATEFFLRGQIPVRYLPIMLMAYLGSYIGYGIAYLLVYMIHLWVALYFAQRMAVKYFSLSRSEGVLFAASCMPVLCHEMWYSSHAIISFLVIPLFYFLLWCREKCPKKYWGLLPMPTVIAFSAGYITLALSLVVAVWFMAVLYVFFIDENTDKKNRIFRVTAPVVAGGMIVLLYYFAVLIYIKKTVNAGSYCLADAVAMKLNVENFAKIVLYSFNGVDGIEQLPIITIGIIWVLCLISIIACKKRDVLKNGKAIFCKIAIGINLLLLLVSCGTNTPLGVWFYSVFPIIGQTHLPIRYMMITLPFLFLAFTILYQTLSGEEGKDNKRYYVIFWICMGIAFALCFIFAATNNNLVAEEKLILEILVLGICSYFIYKYGWKNKKVIFVWSVYMIFIGVDIFYSAEHVTAYQGDVSVSSLMYSDDNKQTLNEYIESIDKKGVYRFIHLDSTQPVTTYIPGNYEWFNTTDYNITNYIGMDIHTCLPEEYRQRFYWFNIVDWTYLMNTRADFVVADQESIDENEIMSSIVDWSESNKYLNNIYRICTLKKYVPTYYTNGELYVEDFADNVMDNGYFYCPYLTNEDVKYFDTDNATYYEIVITAYDDEDVAFLLYPNRHYKYYVDGIEVEPTIHDMQAYIKISAGTHSLTIKYDNKLDLLANGIMFGYYGIFGINIVVVLFIALSDLVKKRRVDNL